MKLIGKIPDGWNNRWVKYQMGKIPDGWNTRSQDEVSNEDWMSASTYLGLVVAGLVKNNIRSE